MKYTRVILGFRRGVVRFSLFWNVMQRRFGSYLPVFRINLSCPISKGLPLESGIDDLSRNVGNYQPTLRDVPEEQRSDMCPLL